MGSFVPTERKLSCTLQSGHIKITTEFDVDHWMKFNETRPTNEQILTQCFEQSFNGFFGKVEGAGSL